MFALGKFRREDWREGRVCVDVLTLVEIILLLQSLDGLEPAASRENPLSRVHDVSLAFVLALESHLCHRTGIPFEALVAMVRACVFLRFTAAQGWAVGQRLRTT